MARFEDVKVGDKVIVTMGGWGRNWQLSKIEKVGKLHITVDGDKYNKVSGRRAGREGYYGTYVIPFDQKEWGDYLAEIREKKIRRRLNDFNWNNCSLKLALKVYELLPVEVPDGK